VAFRRLRRADLARASPRTRMYGYFAKGTDPPPRPYSRARPPSQPPSPAAFPDPLRSPLSRSRGFHRVCGTIRPSDDSPGAASHFAHAYRVASPGATREPCESSWGHVLVFRTVPSANTLIRWVDEKRLRPHSAGSTLPHLWPTGSSRGGPHRLRPGTSPHALRIPPHGGHPALRLAERWLQVRLGGVRLSPSCPT
jgi:hypothetical protein